MSDLISASRNGDTEAIKLLLAAPGVNVNKATVSLYYISPIPPSSRGEARLLCLIPHSNPRNDDPPPPSLSISLQDSGWTALTNATVNGHIEAIKLLLAAPGIDVTQANVSLYLLTPPPLAVGGRCDTHFFHRNPRNDDLPSPNA